MISRSKSGHLAMLGFSVLVSLSFNLGHTVAGDIAPAALTTVRFAIAGVVMFVIARIAGISLVPVFTRFWRWALIGGMMAIYFITMFEALRITSPVSTAAVFTLTPFLAAGFGLLLVGQRTGPWALSALAIGAVGALWVIFGADLGALIRFQIGRGEALFMIGAVAHATVPGLLRRLTQGEIPFQTSLASIVGALLVTGIYGLPDLIVTDFLALRPAVWLVALYLGTITTAGTFFLLQFAAQRLPAGKVMAYTYLVPSWVVLWDFLMRGQTQPMILLAGVVLTLLALLMLLRDEAT